MSDELKRAVVINTLLVAQADGVLADEERELLGKMFKGMGVNASMAALWYEEHIAKGYGFLPVADPNLAEVVVKRAIDVVAADGRFEPGERKALLALAKSVDMSTDRLHVLIADRWPREFTMPAKAVPQGAVLLIPDGFDDVEAFIGACPDVTFEVRGAGALPEDFSGVMLIHALPQAASSITLLTQSRRRNASVIAVVGRHQGGQVSQLLEAGAARCLVQPLYPGELEGALLEIMVGS